MFGSWRKLIFELSYYLVHFIINEIFILIQRRGKEGTFCVLKF